MTHTLRVIFAGTPEFAAAALAAIHEAGFPVPLVLTQPDRPAGRGMKLQASAVKRYAVEHGFRRFDFTIGDEPYKRDWADVTVLPRDYIASQTALGAAVVLSRLGFLTLKRFIKQTPALWSLFLKLRSLKARLAGDANPPAPTGPGEAE